MTDDGPRLSVSLGLTLKIPGSDYEFIRPEVAVSNIDPAGDVTAQVKLALGAAVETFGLLGRHVGEEVIPGLFATAEAGVGVAERVAETERAVTYLRGRLNEVVDGMNRFAAGKAGETNESETPAPEPEAESEPADKPTSRKRRSPAKAKTKEAGE